MCTDQLPTCVDVVAKAYGRASKIVRPGRDGERVLLLFHSHVLEQFRLQMRWSSVVSRTMPVALLILIAWQLKLSATHSSFLTTLGGHQRARVPRLRQRSAALARAQSAALHIADRHEHKAYERAHTEHIRARSVSDTLPLQQSSQAPAPPRSPPAPTSPPQTPMQSPLPPSPLPLASPPPSQPPSPSVPLVPVKPGAQAQSLGGNIGSLENAILELGYSFGVELEFCYRPRDAELQQQLRKARQGAQHDEYKPLRRKVLREVASLLRGHIAELPVATSYETSCKETSKGWRVVLDVSVWNYGECKHDESDIEVVSPPIRNRADLAQLRKMMGALQNIGGLSVTQSTGLHVHVGAGALNLQQLRVLAQHLIKYEMALDMLVPAERRVGNFGGSTHSFIESNRHNRHFEKRKMTNLQVLKHLGSAPRIKTLVQWVNPNYSARYVVSLRRLVRDDCKRSIARKAMTVEFRQQVSTLDTTQLLAWVNFLVRVVSLAVAAPAPTALPDQTTGEAALKHMLHHLMRDDRALDAYGGALHQLRRTLKS